VPGTADTSFKVSLKTFYSWSNFLLKSSSYSARVMGLCSTSGYWF